MKTYLITYRALDGKYRLIQQGKMKVHNCNDEIHAQIKLEKYLAGKLVTFRRLVVESVVEDYLSNLFNMFG